jgi:hypothetical protein
MPLATIASLPLLELDLPPAELLEDLAVLLEDFALLELDFASLELDLAVLLEEAATLELLGIAFQSALISKIPNAVEGIFVTTSVSRLHPRKV